MCYSPLFCASERTAEPVKASEAGRRPRLSTEHRPLHSLIPMTVVRLLAASGNRAFQVPWLQHFRRVKPAPSAGRDLRGLPVARGGGVCWRTLAPRDTPRASRGAWRARKVLSRVSGGACAASRLLAATRSPERCWSAAASLGLAGVAELGGARAGDRALPVSWRWLLLNTRCCADGCQRARASPGASRIGCGRASLGSC